MLTTPHPPGVFKLRPIIYSRTAKREGPTPWPGSTGPPALHRCHHKHFCFPFFPFVTTLLHLPFPMVLPTLLSFAPLLWLCLSSANGITRFQTEALGASQPLSQMLLNLEAARWRRRPQKATSTKSPVPKSQNLGFLEN